MTESTSSYVLTLDDEADSHLIIGRSLRMKNHWVKSGSELLHYLSTNLAPSAIFIDINLNNGEIGLDSIPGVIAICPYVPIFIITATQDSTQIDLAFAHRNIEFLRKPFVTAEIIGRFKQKIADNERLASNEEIRFGDIVINRLKRSVSGNKGIKTTTALENAIIAVFASHPTKALAIDFVKANCWTGTKLVSDSAYHRIMYCARKIISEVSDSVIIEAQYGLGSRMILAEDSLTAVVKRADKSAS